MFLYGEIRPFLGWWEITADTLRGAVTVSNQLPSDVAGDLLGVAHKVFTEAMKQTRIIRAAMVPITAFLAITLPRYT
jgi:hypothetical protein